MGVPAGNSLATQYYALNYKDCDLGKSMNDPNRAAFSMAICTLSEERRKKALAEYDRNQKELEELIRSLALEDDQQGDYED